MGSRSECSVCRCPDSNVEDPNPHSPSSEQLILLQKLVLSHSFEQSGCGSRVEFDFVHSGCWFCHRCCKRVNRLWDNQQKVEELQKEIEEIVRTTWTILREASGGGGGQVEIKLEVEDEEYVEDDDKLREMKVDFFADNEQGDLDGMLDVSNYLDVDVCEPALNPTNTSRKKERKKRKGKTTPKGGSKKSKPKRPRRSKGCLKGLKEVGDSGTSSKVPTQTARKSMNSTSRIKNSKTKNKSKEEKASRPPPEVPELKYKCSECPTKFKTRQSRTKHEHQVHSKLREFKCEQCPKKFLKRSDLFRHIRIRHVDPGPRAQTLELEAVEGQAARFTCEECSKTFTSSSHLASHRKRIHLGIKNFKCTNCEKEFFHKGDLTRHITTYHDRDGFLRPLCDRCGKSFASKHNLNQHQKVYCIVADPESEFGKKMLDYSTKYANPKPRKASKPKFRKSTLEAKPKEAVVLDESMLGKNLVMI